MDGPVVLIGCGSQARFVIEILHGNGQSISNVFDPIGNRIGEYIGDYMIEDFSEFLRLQERRKGEQQRSNVIICLSDKRLKKTLFKQLETTANIVNAIHPNAAISTTARLGKGNIIKSLVELEFDCQIGNGCMFHAKSIIGHDSIVGNFAFIGAGVICCGEVSIGEGATIYTGTILSPTVKVGENSVVGAGSVVLNDIPPNVLAYGSPARVIREIEEAGADKD